MVESAVVCSLERGARRRGRPGSGGLGKRPLRRKHDQRESRVIGQRLLGQVEDVTGTEVVDDLLGEKAESVDGTLFADVRGRLDSDVEGCRKVGPVHVEETLNSAITERGR